MDAPDHRAGKQQGSDGSTQASRWVTIRNPTGLHLRPAKAFVETAGRFKSAVFVTGGSQKANGKSIMELLTLAALPDSRILIEAEGPDAADAVSALSELLEQTTDTNA